MILIIRSAKFPEMKFYDLNKPRKTIAKPFDEELCPAFARQNNGQAIKIIS